MTMYFDTNNKDEIIERLNKKYDELMKRCNEAEYQNEYLKFLIDNLITELEFPHYVKYDPETDTDRTLSFDKYNIDEFEYYKIIIDFKEYILSRKTEFLKHYPDDWWKM